MTLSHCGSHSCWCSCLQPCLCHSSLIHALIWTVWGQNRWVWQGSSLSSWWMNSTLCVIVVVVAIICDSLELQGVVQQWWRWRGLHWVFLASFLLVLLLHPLLPTFYHHLSSHPLHLLSPWSPSHMIQDSQLAVDCGCVKHQPKGWWWNNGVGGSWWKLLNDWMGDTDVSCLDEVGTGDSVWLKEVEWASQTQSWLCHFPIPKGIHWIKQKPQPMVTGTGFQWVQISTPVPIHTHA